MFIQELLMAIQDVTVDVHGSALHYRNDERLRKAETKINLMPEHMAEYQKCKNDIIYFIENYCKINDPDKGWTIPKLYSWQIDFLKIMAENRYVIGMVSRQNGKSTLAGLFLTHYMIFNNDKTNIILAQRAKTAREIFSRVLQTYRSVPQFLKSGIYEYNKSHIHLDSGSRTLADATTEEGPRGYAVSGCLLIDECAIIPKTIWSKFYESVYPTISRSENSKIILISTPKGRNHFFEIWNGAVTKTNSYKSFKATWRDIPGRDDKWKAEQIANLGQNGDIKFRQEFDVEFIEGGDDSLINPDVLQAIEFKQPKGKLFNDESCKIYSFPDRMHVYLACCDVGQGVGGDYSTISVVDVTVTPYEQVAVYRSNIVDLVEFPHMIDKVSKYYNNALIIIENNSEGISVVKTLIYDIENENVYLDPENKQMGGIRMTYKTKRIGSLMFKQLVERNGIKINDIETIREMGNFIKKDNKNIAYCARNGCHDDLVMGLVNMAYFLTTEMGKEIVGKDMFQNIHQKRIKEIQDEQFLPVLYHDDGDGITGGEQEIW